MTGVDLNNLFRLDGKVVLVTGASSGLGDRFARVLHAAGAQVVVSARRLDRLEALVVDLPGSIAIQCDVSVADQRVALIESTVAQCGTIDVLINNAGIGVVGPVETESLDTFENVLNVNTTAVWHLSKLAGAHMVAQRSGSIVNIASVLAHVGSTPIKQSNYCTSKAAVVGLTRELALQWSRKGVRVNALCPGWFPSELTEGMQTDESARAFIARECPLSRMGTLDELDGPLLVLASGAGGYITGQSIIVDGGWTAR